MLALHTGITFFVSEESQVLCCGYDLFLSLIQIPTKNIEGQMTPYYPVELGNGTPCSLRQNLPRSSTVMYICHPEAKHEILSVAEVTTCEYEVVILTPLLCNHPKYRYRALLSPLSLGFLEGSSSWYLKTLDTICVHFKSL
ncbi:ERLEC protein, partial [Spizella passerina]|nr:ERLEC protein [Spizella passerina]